MSFTAVACHLHILNDQYDIHANSNNQVLSQVFDKIIVLLDLFLLITNTLFFHFTRDKEYVIDVSYFTKLFQEWLCGVFDSLNKTPETERC